LRANGQGHDFRRAIIEQQNVSWTNNRIIGKVAPSARRQLAFGGRICLLCIVGWKQVGDVPVASLKRDDLQAFLDERKHMARSMVDHLRWE